MVVNNSIDFSEVYKMHYNRLFHIANSITRDMHLAEDIVHETFIKAMSKVETIEEKSKVASWLSVITTRTAIDFVRRDKYKKAIPMEQAMLEYLGQEMKHNVEGEVTTGLLTEQVNRAIGKMKQEYQNVIKLKAGNGLKENEIAYFLSLKPSTVKTRLFRARRKLKQLLQEQPSTWTI
ncbi:RNA polymerase sigma factor [Neobacillus kokaensis]|uniref:RNA polymerase sigma factor SigV n=1 Tax=Neobacillus kokaensis TaxID=2759023 RepID=A0ABQ3N1X5_9BACI|nr:RNA polymerase sigma factor [Neobacillus kokaensis]GHH98948.1 RNA polymerase sigma factor SigV [Neobacillus kokaensis]